MKLPRLKMMTLIAVGATAAAALLLMIGIDRLERDWFSSGMDAAQKLKSDKINIVDYRVAASSSQRPTPEDTVIYNYVSDKIAPAADLAGLQEDLSKRTANSQLFLRSYKRINPKQVKEEYLGRFYAAPTFSRKNGKWFQIESATTTRQAFFRQIQLTLLDRVRRLISRDALADTYYSSAGDGYANSGQCNNYSTCITTTSAAFVYPTNATMGAGPNRAGKWSNYRAYLTFDTSAIPSGATVNSASLSVVPSASANCLENDAYQYFNVVQTTQAGSDTLIPSDYSKCGSVANAATGATPINSGNGLIAESRTDFILNATGTGWIAKNGSVSSCGVSSGVTCLGIREGHDLQSFEPASQNSCTVFLYTSEQAGTTQDPYLVVNYTYIANDSVSVDGGTLQLDGGTLKID